MISIKEVARRMVFWVIAILVLVMLSAVAALETQRRLPHFENAAQGLQGVATTMAILFAGYWYLYERKGQPQANTALSVTGVKVAPDLVLLRARYVVHNMGATVLYVGDLDARLQALDRTSLPLDKIRRLPKQDFPDVIDGADIYDHGMLTWPTIRWFRGGGQRRIEPGEKDARGVEFIAECSHAALRVYVGLQRPGDSGGWEDQADLGMVGLCAAPVGTKQVLSRENEAGDVS